MNNKELDRYLNNLSIGALQQMIRSFMKDPPGTKEFVEKQVIEFGRMF